MLMSLESTPNWFVPRQVYTPSIAVEVKRRNVVLRTAVSGDSCIVYSSFSSSTVRSDVFCKGGTTEKTNYEYPQVLGSSVGRCAVIIVPGLSSPSTV